MQLRVKKTTFSSLTTYTFVGSITFSGLQVLAYYSTHDATHSNFSQHFHLATIYKATTDHHSPETQ